MLRKLLSSALGLCILLLFSANVYAQDGTVTGKLTDSKTGEPLPGANVLIVELNQGAATNAKGVYTLEDVPTGTYTLRATFVGYDDKEVTLEVESGTNRQNIKLTPSTVGLDNVVVTAFGLTREQKSLSYSVQDVSGEQLSTAAQTDVIESLSSQVSGVQVIGNAGAAIGGSPKIRIRGASGLSTSDPLIVVNGTPISNQKISIADRDYGNLASDLNLDNVESVSVLKGAAAAALYGNRAADGVVVIKTKGGEVGEQPVQVNFSNKTTFSEVGILPGYQNKYAGGYSGRLHDYTDPVNGQTYKGLQYQADESWGPPMNGQEYRPWWSWYHGDFDGDGQDDYGETANLNPKPDNIRNFFDTGLQLSNSITVSGGASNASFRASVEDFHQKGVFPNSRLDKMFLNFNGALQHTDKLTSKLNFSYVNTQTRNRPAQTYSPDNGQGSPFQMFNQWFQRQLSMDELQNYKLADGTITTWNIRSPTNLRGNYWNSPYFTVNENIPRDERDRLYGNYEMKYNLMDNLSVSGIIHADVYAFSMEDRVASGGLETDWFMTRQITRREMNYEANLNYQNDFGDISFDGFLGANLRQERYNRISEETSGGLSTPNLFNISASVSRPNVSNYKSKKDVSSLFGTFNFGWRDMVYADITLRNDWSSTLPDDNNSYLYYGFSGSFIFTEAFDVSNNILSFGKLRASIAQVGNDVGPYRISQTYNVTSPFGSSPSLTVPDTRPNTELKPAISTDYEVGLDLRFLDGDLRLDGTYYESIAEDEILQLDVSSSSGYDQVLINAGKFTKKGVELMLSGTPVQTQDFSVDMTVNWSKILSNKVNKLHPDLKSRLLEKPTYFSTGSPIGLWAEEGAEWGKVIAPGYTRNDNGEPIINPASGMPFINPRVNHGTILPDWNGGFNTTVNYNNFSLSASIGFQKGGLFYSISKMFNNYSGLGEASVGTNPLGNPYRDPVLTSNGTPAATVQRSDAHENSGGILVSGVDQQGNPVEYLTAPTQKFLYDFVMKDPYMYDASYVKLRNVQLTYNLPNRTVSQLPVRSASISVHAQNPWLIYANADGMDPSIVQDVGNSFGWWEGAQAPNTRSVGFSVNLGF